MIKLNHKEKGEETLVIIIKRKKDDNGTLTTFEYIGDEKLKKVYDNSLLEGRLRELLFNLK